MKDHKNKKVLISFLIVNWQGGRVFKDCIRSILSECSKSDLFNYEIIVVDNNSSDLDEEWLRSIKNVNLIKNKKNHKFSYATNQSVSASRGEFIFILNNDIILHKNSVHVLLRELIKDKNIDLVAPKLVYPNGEIQKSIVGLPSLLDVFCTSIGINNLGGGFDNWINNQFNYKKRQRVTGQAAFSAMLLKRRVWDLIGQLDERFPLLWNDTDWFYRFQSNNSVCYYIPHAKATHIHGMSVNRNRIKKIAESTKSMYLYFKKNHKLKNIKLIALIIICGYTFCIRIILEYIIIIKSRVISLLPFWRS